ncbi:sensor histidine kinase [Halofilum ochraceum]|uniref:sensor histidine kinase n=1 Tax=Halofilum ochraceum TaxID=1611323 RepID=UPI00111320C1|nr:ATP-binding protein [Halofilum ochraceum]
MRGRRRLYSMVMLVVAGFALVALPLLVAVVGGSVYLDRLTRRSEQLVRDGVMLSRQGQTLETQLLQMERNARQYRILGRDELVGLYQERHTQLTETLDSLGSVSLDPGAADARMELRGIAESVSGAIAEADPSSESLVAALERFARMRDLATGIARAADTAIRAELDALERQSARVREFLFWLTVTLVPITLALTALFAWLILRPIGRLGRAIRSLGAVEPPAPIAVGGPPEIRDLGEELERLRVRLDRSEAEKNRFLRHMSHELKTPLSAIREGTELIADGSVGVDTPAHREIVDILRSSSVELQQLIENLLVLSARDLSRKPEHIDPAALIDEAISRHRLAISSARLEVERQVDGRGFDGFRSVLQSAVSNLIGNAIRFSPEGGALYVRARRRGQRLIIEVADEGPGIPAAERPHVFEPFFQGEASPQGHVRGTGVGLSVVRDCVRAHDGRVEIVDGEYPGAHIRITLHAQQRPRIGGIE